MMASIRTGLNNLQFIDLGLTPTQTGNTTFTLAGNQMQWYPYGNRVQANVGGTLLYGTVISSSFTSNTGITLRFDVGEGAVLTGSLSAVATGYPSAALGALPEITYRQHNYITNGQFEIWQRGPGPHSYSSGAFGTSCDFWKFNVSVLSAGATAAITRSEFSAAASNVPTLAQCGVFLQNSMLISCNAAVAGLASSDVILVTHIIEGFDFRHLAGKPMTLSFWVNSGVTGTYCVALGNAGKDYSIIMNYSISSVATWEKKIINFAKSPIGTGTWDYSYGAGLQVYFTLAAGGNLMGGAGNWTAGNLVASPAQTNFFANANKSIRFAGVQLVEGNQDIPLAPYDYQQELARCQRRLFCPANINSYPGYVVDNERAFYNVNLPVQMRAAASFSFDTVSHFIATTPGGSAESVSAVLSSTRTPNAFLIDVRVVGTPFTPGQGSSLLFSSSATQSGMIFKAEL